MADHITDKSVTAAARALNLQASDGLDEWDDLSPKEQRRFMTDARRVLAAALPVLNTATGEAIADELDRRADEFESQAKVFGNPHDSTPAAGTVATLLDLAGEFRSDAASLRGEQGE